MSAFRAIAFLILAGLSQAAWAQESGPLVQLYWHGEESHLFAEAKPGLARQALALVQSSNFHSGPGDKHHIFAAGEVQDEYKKMVTGQFLVVTLPAPRELATHGGAVTVSEILVGLNRPDYASNLFTVDETGAIVGHSMYAGEMCVAILKAVNLAMRGK